MKIAKQDDIALLLVASLAKESGKRMPLSKIAEDHGVSSLFLKKIVRMLKNAGLVNSKEGLQGGYTLNKHPKDISVWEVLYAVSSDTHAHNSQKRCPVCKECLPQQISYTLSETMERSLSKISLLDIIRS